MWFLLNSQNLSVGSLVSSKEEIIAQVYSISYFNLQIHFGAIYSIFPSLPGECLNVP